MTMASFTDIVTCLLILALASISLRSVGLFRAVVVFIVFGLVMALSWARLDAPDLALTEAALGAGVIGAMFLAVLGGHRRRLVAPPPKPGAKLSGVVLTGGLLVSGLIYLLGRAGVFAAWSVPAGGLAEPAYGSLPLTGVSNPVTAVILNYRVYDTFLEIGVLFLVMLCIFALQPERLPRRAGKTAEDPLLQSYVRRLVPLMALAAGYLLWAGGFRPGGAFQAGSMLGGAGIMLLLSRPAMTIDMRGLPARLVLAVGFFSFLFFGVAALLGGLEFLQWPPHLAKYLILAIETGSTLSIGLTLTGLYAALDGRLISPATGQSVRGRGP